VVKFDYSCANCLRKADPKSCQGNSGSSGCILCRHAGTDAGLKELAGLKSLQKLYLRATKVTSAGFDALEKALPACRIGAIVGPVRRQPECCAKVAGMGWLTLARNGATVSSRRLRAPEIKNWRRHLAACGRRRAVCHP
jgi:hypothetical protein